MERGIVDPNLHTIEILDEDETADLFEHHQRLTGAQLRTAILRRRRRHRQCAMNASSEDSDDDRSGLVKISLPTPNGSTPAEAVPEGEKPKVEKLDPTLVGMSVGLKHLYSGKEDKRGRFQWQTTIPEDVGKPAEDAETQKWALIIRNVKVG